MTKATSGTSEGSKVPILVAVCLAGLVLPLSFSGGAVATPAIGRELGGSAIALSWITNAFMLSFGSLLMAAGALADQYGRKRLFTIGVAAFAIVSLASSLAPSVPVLDLLRAAQGVAAAAALSSGSAALAQEFEGDRRTRAFSLLGTTFGLGLAFGPLLAGWLIEHLGWRSIFLSATIVGAAALLVGVPRMRETRDPDAAGLDWPGTITFTGALSLFTFGVIQAPDSGWSSLVVVSMLTGALFLFCLFLVVEARVARPMLDLSLFRYPRFVGVQVLPVATCYCYVVLLVLLPLRFIGVEGHSEVEAGLLMMALSAPLLAVPLLAAQLTRWFSPGIVSGVGLLIAAGGLLWLGRIAPSEARHTAVLPMLLIGIGTGMPWGLMDGLSVSVVPKERAGMATGIFSTMRVAGEGVALAIVTAILAGLAQSGLRDSLSETVPPERLAEAAQRLATGDIAHALPDLPGMTPSLLAEIYGDAFRGLVYVLTAITLLAALAVFAFLTGRRPKDTQGEAPAALAVADPGCP